ncbi:MAG: beta-N-acetylhexosaminidase, partial [Bacteroidaceae bacterium]|nr:beta-N-acetylhexosaminidase [Bacteroidaceae bacterium]
MLPVPQHMQVQGGSFQIGKVKLATPVLQAEWESFIAQAGGEVSDKASHLIQVKLVPEVQGAKLNQEEAYRLKVTSKGIEVEATTRKGVFWALQTLRQLEQKKGS